jgi:diaminopimelate dehydrogenase
MMKHRYPLIVFLLLVTSSVLVAYARAIARLATEGSTGAKTVFDIAPAYLSPFDGDYLRAHML